MRKEHGPFALFPAVKRRPITLRRLAAKVRYNVAQTNDSVGAVLGVQTHVLFRAALNVGNGACIGTSHGACRTRETE